MKRYAPDKPDSSLHRPGDTAYLRELLAAAGLSQRKAGPLLGMDERSMRYKVAGDKPLTYPEQYCLEVLADQSSGAPPQFSVHEEAARYGASAKPGVWYSASDRPLTRADADTIIAAVDESQNLFACGHLVADAFGLSIRFSAGVDEHRIPIERVKLYSLIPPPLPRDLKEQENRTDIDGA